MLMGRLCSKNYFRQKQKLERVVGDGKFSVESSCKVTATVETGYSFTKLWVANTKI